MYIKYQGEMPSVHCKMKNASYTLTGGIWLQFFQDFWAYKEVTETIPLVASSEKVGLGAYY